MSFSNKVVIITGAGSGMGEATALKFAREAAKLSLIDINYDNLLKVSTLCEQMSSKEVLKIVADVSEEEDINRIVKETLKEYTKVDAVVNCVGISGQGGILDTNLMETYDRVMNVNLRSIVALTHRVAPALIESKGSIVNISSSMILAATKSWIPYTVAKAGVLHFSKNLALELARKGVRVNTILPGVVKTHFFINNGASKEYSDSVWEKLYKNVPLKHLTEAEEIADLILFLTSDKAKSITGAEFVIDSGLTMHGLHQLMESL